MGRDTQVVGCWLEVLGIGLWVTRALFTQNPEPITQNPKPQAHSALFTQYPRPTSPQRAPLHLMVADPCGFPPIRSLVNVEVTEKCRRFLLQHA